MQKGIRYRSLLNICKGPQMVEFNESLTIKHYQMSVVIAIFVRVTILSGVLFSHTDGQGVHSPSIILEIPQITCKGGSYLIKR